MKRKRFVKLCMVFIDRNEAVYAAISAIEKNINYDLAWKRLRPLFVAIKR